MYYEVRGDGEDLLVIPGLSLDVSEIQYIIEGLSVQYRVTTFDNRGAGRTDQPAGPYSIPMMANDTIGLLDALGISSARVVGISMGAKIAMEMSIRYPNRVSALVLVGAQYRSREKIRLSLLMTVGMWVKKLGFAKGRYPQSDQAFAAQRRRPCRTAAKRTFLESSRPQSSCTDAKTAPPPTNKLSKWCSGFRTLLCGRFVVGIFSF